jgi:hypothetical protein
MVAGLVGCSGGSEAPVSTPVPGDGSPAGSDVPTTPISTTLSTGTTESSTSTQEPSGDPVATSLAYELHDEVGSLVYVSWDQAVPGTAVVQWSVDAGVWNEAPAVEGAEGAHEQLIVGIPFAQTAAWRVQIDGRVVDGPPIETAPLPDGLPVATVSLSEPDRWEPDANYLLTSVNAQTGGWVGGTYYTVLLDRAGRVVWALRTPRDDWTLYPMVSAGGDHLLIDRATAWSLFDHGLDSVVERRWLDAPGEVIPTPGLHHAFWEHADGTLAWGSIAAGDSGEVLVELAPGADEPVVLWDCFADFPGVLESSPFPRCESNSLWYDADRDTYLYSFYTNSSMVELSRSSGETLWWAGAQPGGYAFDPPESQFDWQHGISWTDTGTLLVSSRARHPQLTTKLIEYEVDEQAGVLTEVWSYDAGIHASTNGDARRLPSGNTLHAVGSAGQVHEVDADGQPVWVLDYQTTRLVGRAEFVTDPYALLAPPEPNSTETTP